MITKRFLATGIDLSCSALPFAILGPLAFSINSSGAAPNGLIAELALLLALIGSALLFALLNLLQGLRGAPTPGQKLAKIEFDRGGVAALIRVLTGSLFLLPGIFFSAWTLLLLYPAWLLITGRSLSEQFSQSQMQISGEKT